MKRILKLLMVLVGLSVWESAHSQQIILTQPTNPAQCTGDPIDLQLQLSAAFNCTNHFIVELAEGSTSIADFTSSAIVMPIDEWLPSTGSPCIDTNNAGNKVATVTIPSTLTVGGTYSIRIRSTDPVVVSDTITLNLVITPTVSIDSIVGGFDNIHTPTNPDDLGRCTDDTIVLYAIKGNANYQWFINGLEVNTDDPFRVGNFPDNLDSIVIFKAGDYNVVTTAAGCVGSSDTLTINNYVPTPFIMQGSGQPWVIDLDTENSIIFDSILFCEVDSALYHALAPTNPSEVYTYQWYKDSLSTDGVTDSIVSIAGQTNDSIYITSSIMAGSLIPDHLVLYLEVTDVYSGCKTMTDPGAPNPFGGPRYIYMDTIPRTEISAIPWPGQTTASMNLCPDDSVRLRADVTGGSDWRYQWQVLYPLSNTVWQPLPDDTLSALTVDTDLVPDSAQYRLVTRNRTCTHVSAPIQVNIIPFPTFQFLPSDSTAICAGDSVLVAVTGNGLQYNWSNGFIGTSQYISVPGDYVVEAVGTNLCSTFDTLILYPLVVNANAGPDQTVDRDENVEMAGSGGVTYYWYADKPAYFSNPQDPNTLTRPIADSTKYYVEVTSANGCTGIDSMMVYFHDIFNGEPDLSNVSNLITPNGDGFNDVLDLSDVLNGDLCDLSILNRWGATVYADPDYGNDWSGTNDGGDPLNDGTYYIIVSCGDDVRYMGAVTITRNEE